MKKKHTSLVFTVKSPARTWAREQAAHLSPDYLAQASAKLVRRLLAEDWMALPSPLGLFRSTGSEVDTRLLYSAAFDAAWSVASPHASPSGRYVWHADDNPSALETGPHGILQPPASAPTIDPASLRVILVPGLAFDRQGHRLGHGAGIYDRLLAPAQPTAMLVGLCFSPLLVDSLPAEPHDIPMDLVLTESSALFLPSAAPKLAHLLGTC